jgi:5-methylcytosine-specific restriction endonuclease McrA
MRPGGEKRGNNADRRRRKVWMLATFDLDLGPDKARCKLGLSSRCRGELTFDTITADRIDPGGTYRHENVQPACRACQHEQGALITRERRHQWLAWMEEARMLGIEWDGVI